MPLDSPASTPPSAVRRANQRSFILRAYGILAITTALAVAATFLYVWVEPIPVQDWYMTPLNRQASTVSVTLDEVGALHVAYSYGPLYYGTNRGGAWIWRLVDNQSTCCASLAIDSVGRVHIAYSAWNGSYPPFYLRYAMWDGQVVAVRTFLTASWAGVPSIAIDSRNHVHLSFIAYKGDYTIESLFYATDETGDWGISVAANYTWPALLSDSLVLDGQDRVHIAVGLAPEEGSVGVLSRIGNAWQFEQVDNSADWVDSVSLAVDASGHLHLAYPFLTSLQATPLTRYATNTTGTWSRTDIGPADRSYEALTVDSSGHPHILFAQNSHLMYASDVSGSWKQSEVSSSRGYDEPHAFGIATGPGERIHIVAVHPTSGQTIEYYSDVPPPGTLDTYVARALPFLTWEAIGSVVAVVAVPASLRFRLALQVRHERKIWAAAKYQELVRPR